MPIAINPFDNSINFEYKYDSIEVLKNKIELTHNVFNERKSLSFEEKGKQLLGVYKSLLSEKIALATIISKEMGKPIYEAILEVEKSANVCKHYAEFGEKYLANEVIKTDYSESFVTYQPLGVILAVMPWNFPFWQVFRFAAPALMAGNTVIVKHASNVPLAAQAIEDIFNKHLPKKSYTNIYCESKNIESVIAHKAVKAVTLTGSEKAGSSVASLAGKYIKKTVLELGGNDPFIVLDDADLELASEFALKSRLQNAGQSCIAAKKFIIQENVYQSFISKLINKIEDKIKIGNPLLETTTLGPMSSNSQKQEVLSQVEKTIMLGAKVVYGNLDKTESNFLSPIILDEIPFNAPCYNEEVFGPIFSIFKVKSKEEALVLANDSDLGLSSSVWTNNKESAQYFIDNIQAGAVFINEMSKSDQRLPFGGINNSGYGRELSSFGIKEFCNTKTVVVR